MRTVQRLVGKELISLNYSLITLKVPLFVSQCSSVRGFMFFLPSPVLQDIFLLSLTFIISLHIILLLTLPTTPVTLTPASHAGCSLSISLSYSSGILHKVTIPLLRCFFFRFLKKCIWTLYLKLIFVYRQCRFPEL